MNSRSVRWALLLVLESMKFSGNGGLILRFDPSGPIVLDAVLNIQPAQESESSLHILKLSLQEWQFPDNQEWLRFTKIHQKIKIKIYETTFLTCRQ